MEPFIKRIVTVVVSLFLITYVAIRRFRCCIIR